MHISHTHTVIQATASKQQQPFAWILTTLKCLTMTVTGTWLSDNSRRDEKAYEKSNQKKKKKNFFFLQKLWPLMAGEKNCTFLSLHPPLEISASNT